MKLTIEVISGPMAGKKYVLDSFPVSLGRLPNNDIAFPHDEYISKVHCTIFKDKGNLYIADLKSTNGTYLNGELVQYAITLKDGDTLIIGNTTVKCALQLG